MQRIYQLKIKTILHEINTYPVFSGNTRRVFKPDEAPSSPNSNSGGSLWNRRKYIGMFNIIYKYVPNH